MSDVLSEVKTPAPLAPRRRRAVFVLGPILALATLGGFWIWYHHQVYISTDDAFVEAPVHMVSARIGGQVRQVHVADNQRVRAGDLLVELDPEEAEAALRKAQAQLALARNETSGDYAGVAGARAGLATAEAELTQARLDLERGRALFAREAIARERFDRFETAVRTAEGRRDQAAEVLRRAQAAAGLDGNGGHEARIALRSAELDQARLTLAHTQIFAPADGVVTRKAVETGNNVRPGQALLAVVAVAQPWVVANFKETQITHMRPGQPVSLKIDAFPDHLLSGRIESIMAGTGAAFSLLPPENATGNYVKVVQRVPVKIVLDGRDAAAETLRVGMSVVPTVDTGRSFGEVLAGLNPFH